MSKSNIYKKLTHEDKFARHYYCKHARLNSIRSDKKRNKKWMRRYNRRMVQDESYKTEVSNGDFIKKEANGEIFSKLQFRQRQHSNDN